MKTAFRLAGVVACFVIAATPALAQHRLPPGQVKKVQQPPGGTAFVSSGVDDPAGLIVAGGRVRSLGAWLDDTRVLPRGESWLALSFSRWNTPIATGADAPVVDVSVGVARRLQASVSAPYFRATDLSGGHVRGIGDLYISTKAQLRDPDSHRVGIAVAPTVELLSTAAGTDPSMQRLNWLLPLNLEWRRDALRVYGSTGYFSRGVLFAGGAIERTLTDRLVVSSALTHAYSIDRDALGEEIGLGRRRVDLTGSLSYLVSPSFAVFGSLGRTISAMDGDATRLLASIGVSVNLTRPVLQ